jgi:hypothetical protein
VLDYGGTAAVVLVLVAWLLLSAANQFAHLQPKIGRWDRFALVPVWTFFAPRPFTRDLDLLVRDQSAAGDVAGWRLLTTHGRALRHLVWHPSCRGNKAIVDVCAELLQSISANPEHDASVLVSYRVLESYVRKTPGRRDVALRQFVIVRSSGYSFPDGLQVLLVSPFFSLV